MWFGWPLIVLLGALLATGQMAGYDATKTLVLRDPSVRNGPMVHVAAGTVAGFSATVLQMPADVLITRYQGGIYGPYSGIADCIFQTLRADGPLVFYRGFGLMLVRLTPMIIAGQVVYEQCRSFLGLEYFR